MKTIRVFLLLSLLAALVLAGTPEDTFMDGWYKLIDCRVDMTKDVINDVVDNVPEAEYLKDHIETLETDLSNLGNMETAEEFRAYVRDTYRPHQKEAFDAIRDARLKFREWNVSKEKFQSMKENAAKAIETFEDCKFEALKKIAESKIQKYDEVIEKAREHIDNFSEKHPEVDVSGMEQVVEDAENNFMKDFEKAVDDAENSEELTAAINGYCIGNGCKEGVNFHFYAKSAHAKLSAILDAISEDAKEQGLGDEVDKAQSYLDAAGDALEKVGTSMYTEETASEVWDNLKDAADTIKEIVRQTYGLEGR